MSKEVIMTKSEVLVPDTRLVGRRNSKKEPQKSRSVGWNLNPGPPKDNAGMHPDAAAFGKCDKAEVHEFSKNLETTSNF